MIIPFQQWRPDQPNLAPNNLLTATNVIPAPGGFTAFSGLAEASTNALDSTPLGMTAGQAAAGDWSLFAGDSGKLYRLVGGASGSVFSNVSKSGNYTLSGSNRWDFAQYGERLIAVCLDENPQQFNLTSSSLFSDLVTTHKAKYVAVVRDFVFTAHTTDSTDGLQPTRVRWSAIDDPTNFTVSSATMSDFQNIEGAGHIKALFGGETATVFFDRGIARLNFVGTPVIFQVDMVSRNQGLFASGAAAQLQNNIFFLDHDGFYRFDGQSIAPIGANRVDEFFLADVNTAEIDDITCVVDADRHIVIWSYTSNGATTPNKMLCYHYQLDAWSLVELGVNMVGYGRGIGYTLEQVDNINSSIDALTISLDSPSLQGGTRRIYAFQNNQLYTFSGDNLAATFETSDVQPAQGRRSAINRCRPLTDAGTFTAQIGSKATTASTATFTTASSPTADGTVPARTQGRYHRFKMEIPAATTWTEAVGVEFEAAPLGGR